MVNEAKTSDVLKLHTCPICGKQFIPAPLHRYKAEDKRHRVYKLCSYSCSRKAEKSSKWNNVRKKRG